MPSTPTDSIALLIDADNAPASRIEFIMNELASYGIVNIRRAYGNWKKQALASWEKVLHDHAIQPIQHFDLVKGKNGTDMALVIDAMDVLTSKQIHTFCLVSSDCDFTPLVLRLRSDGKQVIGFGERKTPEPFVNSCTHFLYLDEETDGSATGKTKACAANQLKGNTKLMNTLRNAVAALEDDEGWALLGPVGAHINNQGPFDPRNHGFSKLSDLFDVIDIFELERIKNGAQTIVRVRQRKKVTKKDPAEKVEPKD